jgi:hypothetical protein
VDSVGSVGGSSLTQLVDLVPPAPQAAAPPVGQPSSVAAGPSIADIQAAMVTPTLQAQQGDILGPAPVHKLQPIVNGIAELSRMPVRAVALRSPNDVMSRAMALTQVILSPMSGGGDPGPGGGGPK